LYTRRKLYEAIAKELPVCDTHLSRPVVPFFLPLVLPTKDGPRYLGEDYAFCERARRAGFPILIDTRVRLFQIGDHGYGWEDAGGSPVRRPSYVCAFESETRPGVSD